MSRPDDEDPIHTFRALVARLSPQDIDQSIAVASALADGEDSDSVDADIESVNVIVDMIVRMMPVMAYMIERIEMRGREPADVADMWRAVAGRIDLERARCATADMLEMFADTSGAEDWPGMLDAMHYLGLVEDPENPDATMPHFKGIDRLVSALMQNAWKAVVLHDIAEAKRLKKAYYTRPLQDTMREAAALLRAGEV